MCVPIFFNVGIASVSDVLVLGYAVLGDGRTSGEVCFMLLGGALECARVADPGMWDVLVMVLWM